MVLNVHTGAFYSWLGFSGFGVYWGGRGLSELDLCFVCQSQFLVTVRLVMDHSWGLCVFSTVRLQIASVIPHCFTSPLLYCVSQSWGFFSSFSVVCCSVSLLCGHWLCGTVTGHLIMSSYNLFPNVLSSGMICPFLLRGLSWWLIKVVSYLLNNSACRTYHSHRWRCNHLLWS